MPKISVYIPEDLWERVKGVDPGAGGSQFIQETIREYVDRRQQKPYAVLDADLEAKRDAAAAKAQEKLGKEYRVGYEMGLELTDHLSWDLFATFAGLKWDFDRFYEAVLEAPDEHFSTSHGQFDLDLLWEELARRHGVDRTYPDPGPRLEGAVDALKDIWEGIANAGAQQPTPPTTPAPAARAPGRAKKPAGKSGGVVVPFREEPGDAQ